MVYRQLRKSLLDEAAYVTNYGTCKYLPARILCVSVAKLCLKWRIRAGNALLEALNEYTFPPPRTGHSKKKRYSAELPLS